MAAPHSATGARLISTQTTSTSHGPQPPRLSEPRSNKQASDLNPPWRLDELLRALAAAGVPRFADAIRAWR